MSAGRPAIRDGLARLAVGAAWVLCRAKTHGTGALSWHFSTNDMIGLIAARRPYLTLITSPAKIDT
jgi:hypothetical protein